MYVQNSPGRPWPGVAAPCWGKGRENAMSAKSDLQEAVQARLDKNPMDSRAMFARISFEVELEAGMNESLAAHKWLERLRA